MRLSPENLAHLGLEIRICLRWSHAFGSLAKGSGRFSQRLAPGRRESLGQRLEVYTLPLAQGRSSILAPLTGSTIWRLRNFSRFPLVDDPKTIRGEGCGKGPYRVQSGNGIAADLGPATEQVQFQQGMRFKAILQRRCPRCLRGQVFASAFRMRRNCGVCDLRFERQEPGYFVGALYFAYGLAILLGAPPAAYLWWQGFSVGILVLVVTGELILLSPSIFQYSRILFLHLDQLFDPT